MSLMFASYFALNVAVWIGLFKAWKEERPKDRLRLVALSGLALALAKLTAIQMDLTALVDLLEIN